MFLILFSLPVLAYGQQIFSGSCSEYANTTMPNFDINKYSGRWYEIYRYNNLIEMNGDCTVIDVLKVDNNTFNVDMKLKLSTPIKMHMKAYLIDPSKHDAKLKLRIPRIPELNYWIIDTDYETYTIEWSCTDFLNINLQMLWVLARTPQIDENIVGTVKRIMKEKNLGKRGMRISGNDPENCKCIYNKC
ncbi:PREDICTED: apolipoprotein D-like isoform X2 [Nicrophorus vespilloides]|uniref:Apolipoprotein D-like isoform X2 n=1 Tax=Nicrophorus vespilloides TaxID=110193 RepID=A0ABM1M350_NICVS|nr:PREDICTED: apolipoprotein D-like isoform X2 [Nicrophorus vespilloides]